MSRQGTLFDDAAQERLPGPGGRRFTDEQSRAIRARRGSRLLSANAGSGKTAVVVERFARAVLEDGVDPRRVLAITFTEKAAGELRQRLRERFLELGDRAAARAAEGAFVSTIHGFCARLLRSHPLAAGLDPAFRVLEPAETARLRADAFDAAFAAFLDSAAHTGPEALELSAAYRPDRLFALVDDAHSRLRSRGDTEPTLPDPGERPVPPESRERLRRAHAAAAACLAGAGDGQTVTAARAGLDRAAAFLDDGDGRLPALADLAAAAFKAGNTTVLKGPDCAEYLEALEAYGRAVADHLAGPACRRIGELLAAYGRAYAERKRARSGLDFEDLELMARDLLERDDGVRAAWRARFALIMVDEFQDVNGRQLAILERLEDRNLLTVGDELQSIYGFRHADVEIFRGRRDRLAAEGAAAELRASFRAREPLLQALNAAFAPLFGERFTPLVAGRDDAGDKAPPLAELLVTGQRAWDEDEAVDLGDTLPPAARWRHAEARLLAQRVRELVDAGEAEPGKTAVLVRALTDLAVYERALEDQGLATYVTGGRGYWSGQQVGDLLAHLGALANPRDETRMFTLLASPLAGLSSDGLAALAAARGDRGKHAWWVLEEVFGAEGETASEPIPGMPAEDVERMRDFCPWFATERRGMARRSLEELLERAVTARDYDLHALALRSGARRMANVRKLMRLAREYEAHEGRDVRGFLDSVELRRETDASEGEAPVEPEDLDAVRLMTIHGAKGLEFDTVCVADLGRPGRGDHPDLHVAADGRVGLRLLTLEGSGGVKALDYEALQAERDAADEAEEHRVFYVGMTRARERLLVSGAVPNPDGWPAPALTAPPLAWAGPALAPGVRESLTPARPVWESPTGVMCRLNVPATAGQVLADPGPSRDTGAGESARVAPPTADLVEVVPARTPPVRTLSYSGLEAYGRCPYRFYAERILRLPPPRDAVTTPGEAAEAPGIDPRLRGSLAHMLLERELTAPEDVVALAAELGETVAEADAAEIAELIAGFALSDTGRRLAVCEDLRREAPFAFPLALPGGEVLVNGIVDVAGREGDHALVVDYKSDRLGPEDDLEARAERDYRTQRVVYALAALRDGAREVEVVHSFLERPDRPVSIAFREDDVPRLEQELIGLAEGILAERFEPASEPHRWLCHDCPARPALCSWDESMTLRDPAEPSG
jgi:ATP-dependent helicase/nuclease subunit A